MNESQGSSLAGPRGPVPRAVLLACALVLALAGCGQKGPLFLPTTPVASATRASHVPSAPDDRVPPGPAVAPMPADNPPPAPTGVVPPTQK